MKTMLYLRWVFKDYTSWIAFVSIFLLSFYGFTFLPGALTINRVLLGFVYSLLFSLVATCLFKTLKEKVKETFSVKKPLSFLGKSFESAKRGEFLGAFKTFSVGLVKFLVVLLGVLGIGAAQFCAFGSPVCGFSIGTAIITAIFPTFMVQILYEYANWIVFGAILLQILGLYLMGCFRKVKVLEGQRG